MRKLCSLRFLVLTLVLCLSVSNIDAQNKNKHHKFDPARFQKELEQFIATEATLTPAEAEKFFPLYREMQNKQRALLDQMRRYSFTDTMNNTTCEETIKKQDELDIEIKVLQRDYHEKFMRVIPAGKVFKIIKAEERFHRQAFKRMAGDGPRD